MKKGTIFETVDNSGEKHKYEYAGFHKTEDDYNIRLLDLKNFSYVYVDKNYLRNRPYRIISKGV